MKKLCAVGLFVLVFIAGLTATTNERRAGCMLVMRKGSILPPVYLSLKTIDLTGGIENGKEV